MKKIVIVAVLFSVLLLAPLVLADVYLPPGPPRDMSEYIVYTLHVTDLQDMTSIGYGYTDGPYYWPELQAEFPKIEKDNATIEGAEWIPFSTWVMVGGYFPGVVVSPDQVPPEVVLVITWNGVPYAVTLEAPGIVGMQYPPEKYGEPCPEIPPSHRDLYPCMETVYPWVYPAVECGEGEEWKKAYYNVWWGDIDGQDGPAPFALYFWYIFHPNVGDWEAFDCEGGTKHPPTYDIYAMLEYSNTNIWTNHKCFDVRLLEVHKEIAPDLLRGPYDQAIGEVSNILTITNVGKVPATCIDFIESFPTEPKKALVPKWDTATVKIFGGRHIYATPLALREGLIENGWPFKMPEPYDVLYPGETMVISMEFSVNVDEQFVGTLVVDAEVSAFEIPPWKYPRARDALIILPHSCYPLPILGPIRREAFARAPFFRPPLETPAPVYYYDCTVPRNGTIEFGLVFDFLERREEIFGFFTRRSLTYRVGFFCPLPINENPIPQRRDFELTLDPVPVDLNGDGVIDGQDVALVRQAIVGLIEYDLRMDVNANNKIDTKDLAAFKLEATG